MKVLLVGPYPPPYGGLAVQLCEWRRYLEALGTYECSILNIGESRKAHVADCIPVRGYGDFLKTLYCFASKGWLIHLLTNGHNVKSWMCSFACVLAGARNGRRTVLVYGSGLMPEYMKHAGPLLRLVIRSTVRLGGRFICRNEQMKQALVNAGADPHKIAIVAGFIGLNAVECGPVPGKVRAFLDTHAPILGATASLEPEYGVPLMLAGLEELQRDYPHIGLVLIGPTHQEARSRLGGLERVQDHVLFTGPLPHDVVLGVMTQFTIFLRPTHFDGDSKSVREALALGVPAVASDTGFRPEGVILFRKGELHDLVRVLRHTLGHLDELREQTRNKTAPCDQADRVVGLYKELLNED